MIINNKETKKFSKYQKYQQDHLDKKFSSNFFFKEPIVHGANLALIALSKFLEKKEKIFL